MKYYLLLLAVALLGCVSSVASTVVINNVTISVEVADSPDEWQTGLMHRDSLPAESGMLFVFPGEAPRSFWMKNTLIPLDIMFVAANGTIIDIQQMEPCRAEPCPLYRSAAPAKYALEVNEGFAEAHEIEAGNTAIIKTS